jgi:hypothetical protein
MKKALIYTFLILAIAFTTVNNAIGQPHPGEQSGGGTINGGRIGEAPAGAPVGNGTFILFTLALAYAGRKLYTGQVAEEE